MGRFEIGTKTVHSSYGTPAERMGNSYVFLLAKSPAGLAAICALVLVLLMAGCSSSGASASATGGSVDSTKSEAAPTGTVSSRQSAAFEDAASSVASNTAHSTRFFRVELPADLEKRMTTELSKPDENVLTFYLDNTAVFAVSHVADHPKGHGEEERKLDCYRLGRANDGTDNTRVSMWVFYVRQGEERYGWGKNAHWGDTSTEELACEELINMMPEELAACVQLKNGSDWVQAQLGEKTVDGAKSAREAHPTAETAAGGSAESTVPVVSPASAEPSSTTPFWGIWVRSSQNENVARATADEVSAAGFGGSVVLTTDWSNLSSEPWYAVTAGRYSSKQDAKSHLQRVQAAGYDRAYVKYSGDYQG